MVAEGSLELPSVSPAAIARTLPVLAPMEALDAPVSARFSARFAFADRAFEGRASIEVGQGEIVAGGLRTPFAAVTLGLATDGTTVRVEGAELRPRPARAGAAAPRITMRGNASRFGEAWRVRAELRLDELTVTDLRAYWPEGVAEGARRWIVENLTSGTARDGDWWAEVEIGGSARRCGCSARAGRCASRARRSIGSAPSRPSRAWTPS
ncbi:hypothetical protein ACE7GA_19900 [Roseomonas sp. CCTCC AB2023176]|uniref:hypothetical protein n=1 Tax=Roseomonas sp. CCTCC AB2023176 TaxID=3342640 RepID=UPI0035DA8551